MLNFQMKVFRKWRYFIHPKVYCCESDIFFQGIHVAHVIIDGVVNNPNTEEFFSNQSEEFKLRFSKMASSAGLLEPDDVAEAFWWIYNQPKSTWTHELDLRPWSEKWWSICCKIEENRINQGHFRDQSITFVSSQSF